MRYLFLLYLLIGAIVDIQIKKLPVWWIYTGWIGMGGYGLYEVLEGKRSIVESICALLPGILCFFFAKVSKTMGEGDAIVITITGLGFPMLTVIRVFMIACLLAAIGSIILLAIKRCMKNCKIPFIPYIFLSVVCVVAGG